MMRKIWEYIWGGKDEIKNEICESIEKFGIPI